MTEEQFNTITQGLSTYEVIDIIRVLQDVSEALLHIAYPHQIIC